MKKLTMGVGILALSLGISATAGAATAYYIDYMDNMEKGYTVKQVDDQLKKNWNETDSQIYHETITHAYYKMNDVEKQAKVYADQQVEKYHQEKLDNNEKEIDQHAQEILAELKQHIDQELAKYESGGSE